MKQLIVYRNDLDIQTDKLIEALVRAAEENVFNLFKDSAKYIITYNRYETDKRICIDKDEFNYYEGHKDKQFKQVNNFDSIMNIGEKAYQLGLSLENDVKIVDIEYIINNKNTKVTLGMIFKPLTDDIIAELTECK